MLEILKTKKRKQQEEIERNRNHELLSDITPFGMNFERNKFYLGESLCCIYGMNKPPQNPSVGWLSKLTNIPDIIVSITSIPLDQGSFIQAMNKSVSENTSIANTTKDSLERTRKLKAAEDSQKIMIAVDRSNEAIAGYTLQIMVFGRDKEEFEKKCARVESAASALGVGIVKLSHKQKEAYMHLSVTYPYQDCINNAIERPLPISAFTCGYPYAKSEICDRGGYYLGKSESGGIILFDLWKRTKSRTNSSVTVIGESGMGKSTAIKHIILSEIARGTKVIIIDPEGEYKEICLSDYVEGKWIDVAGGRGGIINPLQIRPAPKDDEDENEKRKGTEKNEEEKFSDSIGDLAIHLKTLQTFFSLYIPSLSDKHKAILEKCLIELYAKFKISWDTDVTVFKNTDFPIMSDLHELIKAKGETEEDHREIYKDLELYLSSAAEGADRGLWNGCTSIEADSKCICLDTKSVTLMGGGVLAAQYFNILSWCWQEISKNRNERVMLIADECWMMIDPSCPQSMVFLRNAEKRARKYEGSVVVSTQQMADFLDSSIKTYGQTVLDTPSVKLLFGMNGQGYREVKDMFHLNSSQSRLIESEIKGTALMCVGSEKFRINFEFSEERLKMFGKGGGR